MSSLRRSAPLLALPFLAACQNITQPTEESIARRSVVSASPRLEIAVSDPVGDNTGPIDVTQMSMTWDAGTGDYEITLTSDPAHPFDGAFRININLFNVDDPSAFNDTGNDFVLAASTDALVLTGSASVLTRWDVGDDVHTNSLGGTPNPPGTSLFRSSVTTPPFAFLTNEDVIAYADVTRPAVVRPATLTVEIDIKPGDVPNSVNCQNGSGVIPVAILTTPDFDATGVDHATVLFDGASESHVVANTGFPRRHAEDVDGDGDTDLVFHFRYAETGLDCSAAAGTLTGALFDGTRIEGTDALEMVGG